MVIAEVSVVPVGTKTPSVSRYVAKAIKILEEQKKVKYEVTAMGTILEGELEDVLDAVRKMHNSLFGGEVKRVVTRITIDDRRDKKISLDYKVRSVKEKLGDSNDDESDAYSRRV